MLRRLLAVFLILASLWVPAFAVQPDEMLDDPALEQRARQLSAQMRCMVCQNQSIDDSDAPLAKDLRVLIRDRLVAGDSNDQVVNYLVSRYGEFVLLQPRFGLHTLILWLGPFAILGLAALAAIKWRRPAGLDAPGEAALSPDEARRLDDLIKRDG